MILTVSELIEKLRDMPGDAKIYTRTLAFDHAAPIQVQHGQVADVFQIGRKVYLNGVQY